MTRYVLRRIALAILVVAGEIVLTFVIARVVPGDPAATWAGPHASREQIERARVDLGLDRPVPEQIARYFGGIASGDWGTSLHTKRPVLADLGRAGTPVDPLFFDAQREFRFPYFGTVFHGGVENQQVPPFGTVDDFRREIITCL